jgi:hypothetical protein
LIQACAAVDEQLHRREVAAQCRLVQGRRVGVVARRVVPVRIFSCVEQDADDLGVPVLRP